jgi:hypothetical protein
MSIFSILMRIVWTTQRQGWITLKGQAFLTVDVLLLRIPQCLWTWAFMIMGTVWQDIAAAATDTIVPAWFRATLNVVALLVTAAEVAITIVAANLLTSHHGIALILYHVGDGILAIAILALVVAGARAAWTVIFLLHAHRTSLSPSRPDRAAGWWAVLCTPMKHDEEEGTEMWAADEEHGAELMAESEEQSAAFAAVYEALRQGTLWLIAGVVVALFLIADVAVDTALGLSTANTPKQYLWYLGIFLACEALGSALLAMFTWPRVRPSEAVSDSISV